MKAISSVMALASFVVGCAAPFAVIDGSRPEGTDPHQYPVRIVAVDDQGYFNGPFEVMVTPGFHYLRLVTAKPGIRPGFDPLSALPFPLFAKPCIRYRIAAQHQPSTSRDNTNWQARVLEQEPVAGCKAESHQGHGTSADAPASGGGSLAPPGGAQRG